MLKTAMIAAVCSALVLIAGCKKQWDESAGTPDAGDAQVKPDGWDVRGTDGGVGVSLLFPVINPLIVSGDTVANLDVNGTYVFNRDPEVLTDYIFLIEGVFDTNGNGRADAYNEPNVGYYAVKSGTRYINPANTLIAMGYSISGSDHLGALARFAPKYDFNATAEAQGDFSVHKALGVATVMMLAYHDTVIPAIASSSSTSAEGFSSISDNASSVSEDDYIEGSEGSSSSATDANVSEGSSASSSFSSVETLSSSSQASSSSEASVSSVTALECGDIWPCETSSAAASSSSGSVLIYLTSLDYDTCYEAGGYMDDFGICILTQEQLEALLSDQQGSSSSASGTIVIYNASPEQCADVKGIYDYAELTCVVNEDGLQDYFDGQNESSSSEFSSSTDSEGSSSQAEDPAQGASSASVSSEAADSSDDNSTGGGIGDFNETIFYPVTRAEEISNKERIINLVVSCPTRACVNEIVRQLAIERNGLYYGQD